VHPEMKICQRKSYLRVWKRAPALHWYGAPINPALLLLMLLSVS